MQLQKAQGQQALPTAQATLAQAQRHAALTSQAVVAAQTQVAQATNHLRRVQAAWDQSQTQTTTAQRDLAQAQQAARQAQSAVDQAQGVVDRARAAVKQAQATTQTTNQITLPAGYRQALQAFMAKQLSSQQLQAIAFSGDGNHWQNYMNKFVHNAADQAVVIDNVFHMSEALRVEITRWTAILLNQVRALMGTTAVVVSPASVAYAQAVANRYNQDHFNNYKEPGHDSQALYAVGDQFKTYWEEDESVNIVWNDLARLGVAGWQTKQTTTTLDEVKENIYEGIVGMLFNDASSNWGHAASLTGLINAKLFTGDHTQALGVSVGRDGWLHFNLGTTSQFGVANTLGKNVYRPVSLTTVGHATAAQQQALATATRQLQTAQATLAAAQARVQAARQHLAQIPTMASAQAAVQTAQTQLATAQARYQRAQTAHVTAQTAFRAAQQEVAALTKQAATHNTQSRAAVVAVEQAQSNLQTHQAALAAARQRQAAAVKAYQAAQATAHAATTKLAALKANMTPGSFSPVAVTMAQADLAVAKQKLATAQAQLALLAATKTASDHALVTAQAQLTAAQMAQFKAQQTLQAAQQHQLRVRGQLAALDKVALVTPLQPGRALGSASDNERSVLTTQVMAQEQSPRAAQAQGATAVTATDQAYVVPGQTTLATGETGLKQGIANVAAALQPTTAVVKTAAATTATVAQTAAVATTIVEQAATATAHHHATTNAAGWLSALGLAVAGLVAGAPALLKKRL